MTIRRGRTPARSRRHSGLRLSETEFQLMHSHYDQSMDRLNYSPYLTLVRPGQNQSCETMAQ